MSFLRALKWKCGIFLSLEGHLGNAEANTSRFTLWRAAAPCRPECALQIFSITLWRQKQITQVSLLSVILSRGFFKQTPLWALFTEITANLLKPAQTPHYCKWVYHHEVAPQSREKEQSQPYRELTNFPWSCRKTQQYKTQQLSMAACSTTELVNTEETRSFLKCIRMSTPTTESHFKAYAETGLHDLTHRFIGEVGSHWSEQQGPQNLQRTMHICPIVWCQLHAFLREGWLLQGGLPWAENLRVF